MKRRWTAFLEKDDGYGNFSTGGLPKWTQSSPVVFTAQASTMMWGYELVVHGRARNRCAAFYLGDLMNNDGDWESRILPLGYVRADCVVRDLANLVLGDSQIQISGLVSVTSQISCGALIELLNCCWCLDTDVAREDSDGVLYGEFWVQFHDKALDLFSSALGGLLSEPAKRFAGAMLDLGNKLEMAFTHLDSLDWAVQRPLTVDLCERAICEVRSKFV